MSTLPVSFNTGVEIAKYVENLFSTKGSENISVEEIKEILSNYTSNPNNEQDWRQYCFPNDIHYTRNLIFANDSFELMILYWKGSQETRIHNHSASRCWMAPLSGEVSESVYIPYLPPGEKAVEDPNVCPDLIITEKSVHKVGDVGFIEDDIGLHKLGNHFTDKDAITLHLYSPPIRELTLFEPEKKTISTRKPGFYSKGGQRV